MFTIVNHTLSAAVATNGTFAPSYPTGKSKGNFEGARGHKMWALQTLFVDPTSFTISFGATTFTVTYTGTTTLPSGTVVSLQLEEQGANDKDPYDEIYQVVGAAPSPLVKVNLGSPITADSNGVIVSQDLTTAGVFSVSTTAAAAIAAGALAGTFDVPRNVVGAWTTTAVLTVTGKDVYGNTIVESSASGTTMTGAKAFKSVSNVSTSVNITSLTVGTGDVLGLPVRLPAISMVLGEFQNNVFRAREPGRVRVPFQIDQTDLLAGTPISVPSPCAGTIKKVVTQAWEAVTTGGAVTMKVNNTSVDGLSVTVADGGGAGDTDSDTPTAGHASTIVVENDELEIIPAAEFATAGALTGYIEIEPSQPIDGTLVAAVDSAASATTGDVRGTYNPTASLAGATSIALLLQVPDPSDLGIAQYAG